MRRGLIGLVTALAVFVGCTHALAAEAQKPSYAIAAQKGATSFEAENPANNLRLTFTGDSVIVGPSVSVEEPWSLDLRLLSVGVQGDKTPVGPAKLSATATQVGYDFGAASVRYLNNEGGVEQVFTVPLPAGVGGKTGQATLAIDLAVGSNLTPQSAPYYVDLLTAEGKKVLRYGAISATDANGKVLDGEIQVVPGINGAPAGVRIIVQLSDAASPIEVHAGLRQPTQLVVAEGAAAPAVTPVTPPALDVPEKQISGEQIVMAPPITETVDDIMARDKLTPPEMLRAPRETHPEHEAELHRRQNPLAPTVSRWPQSNEPFSLSIPSGPPLAPQTVGTSFLGVNSALSSFIPPDSMGDVGPTQILFHENGRIRVFNKTGTLGSLNSTDLAFWTSVDAASQPSDPEIRYDRLSGRWIIMAMNTSNNNNNRVMIAYTAANATITGSASFTFTQFTGPVVGAGGDAAAGQFCLMDYPSFGIDNNAVYIGANMFCGASTSTETYAHSNVWVIPKAGLLAGAPVVTAFRNVTNGTAGPGPYSPMGVDSDDPQQTEGYFIGDDLALFSQLDVIKVSTPGGTPTIGSTIALTVPTTTNPIAQVASGSTTNLDVSDTRLIKASIHKNKITGASTLWTAHQIEVNTSGVGTFGGGRNGARWYEFAGSVPTTGAPLGGSIFLRQAGTVWDSAATNQKGYIYPSVVETGQGHMALGATVASANTFASVAAAGRFRTDTLGTTQAPNNTVVAGAAAYNNVVSGRNRWGDYSFTDVDPLDDQTVWTFQEYCDTANSWAVRAIQLKAPLPATPSSASGTVCIGRASTKIVITGTSASGTEFFDPGPDTGGPGYTNHIAASLANGTAPTVNSITFTDPTHVTLDLNTTSATAGTKNVTITNPDGQTATGTNIVTVVATCSASISGTVTDASTSLGINGATVTANNLTTTTSSTGAYTFSSIPAGTYTVTATAAGYVSASNNVTVVDGQNATQNFSLTLGVSDIAACKTDTVESDFEAGTLSAVDAASSPGNVVLPLTTGQLDQSNTTLNLSANYLTSNNNWDAQSFIAGVTGNLSAVTVSVGTSVAGATVNVAIYNDNGSGSPGVAIAGATANSGAFASTNIIYTLTLNLGTPAAVTAGTRYHLVFKGSNTTASAAFVSPSCAASCNPYTNGSGFLTTNGGTAWTAQTYDFPFQTYVIPTATTGNLISALKDANPSAGNTARWSLSWTNAALPGNTTLQFQAAASNNPAGPFTFVGPGGSTGTFWTTSPVSAADMAQFNGLRYFKYKAILGRTAQGVTPTVNDVTVCFTDGCSGAANGTSCNDGNPCTTSDTCQSNVCVGSSPVSCTAGDQCNLAATCNISTGVCSSTTQKTNGTVCTDGNACTQTDTCQSGVCTGSNPVVCSALDTCHVAGTCNTGTGVCTNPNAPNGTTCNDGSACTSGDSCTGGVCGGTPVVCNDSNVCTTDTCNPASGCVFTNNTNSCDDGSACTSGDTCSGGSCVGTPIVCNDSNVCTTDTCNPASGCVFTNNTNPCSDGSACTAGDICGGGVCIPGTPVVCNDSNVCTTDTCNPASGCVFTNNTNPCSDGNACTFGDTCGGGVCLPGSAVVCNDNNVCTDDSCNPATGCVFTNNTAACDDGNYCTTGDVCAGGSCQPGTGALNCDDNNPCTDDSCDPATGCVHTNNTASCDDGSACTANDTCSGGVCAGTAVVCNDDNPCTDDTCDPSTGCVYTNNTASCDDGNACTSNDTCSGGVCAGTTIVCNDNNVCTTDSCNPATGCVYTNNTNACDDGNACTSGDVCGGGTCHPGTPVVCNDNNVCTTDSCNPATGCVYTNNTNPCSDGNACTFGDTCGGGVCNPGTPVVCNDNNPCTDDTCNPATGCVYTNNTASCDDLNACTSNDTCSGGTCAGTAIVCDDSNPCTDDSCDPSTGCVYTNNTASCDDGSACTSNDTCSGGVCAGTTVVCNDNNPCTDDTCDPSTGCVYTNNTASCDDGNACTSNDTCSGGVCAGTTVVCNDNNVCTTDSCNPATGCVYTNNTNACDDGNACTAGDVCGGGTCHPGTPVVCNDNNVCTTDSCNPATGCVYTNNTNPCSDGNACTFGDTCGGGVCNPGTPVVCNDNNVCTTDTCNPATGCVYTNNTNACDDGNACTSNDTCSGGTCAGTAIVCDDSNPCTDDSCDPSTGCVYTNNTASCDDGNACTSNDTCGGGICAGTAIVCNDNNPCTDDSCNPATGCVYTNNTASCDDGSACTTNDTCSGGVCAGSAIVCNDNNVCTTDTCNPSSGCVYTNNTNPCSDGNACTFGDTCGGGVCNPGTPVVCNDNNVCTTDSCNPATGCVYTNNTNACDDGNACTTGDVCGGGTCHPGGATVCNDNNVCTTDTCNPATGCVYTNNTNSCDDGNACTTGDTCGGGTCHGGAALVCNDNNVCTTDTCNPATGCVYTNNTIACSDGNACTTGDVCGGGTCHPGGATVCNDNNPCTTDSCNPVTGCHFTADDSNTCTDGDLCTTDTCSSGSCVHAPSGLCTVGGVVRYYRDDTGAGSEPSTKGVSATGIDRTGDAVADATTDGSGAYGLGSLVGNVTVTTVNKYGSPRAADANGGITALDASFVARGRVGLLTLSSNQRIAGDVTGDGSLSALDASEIARYAVRLIDHFDVAVSSGSDWKYLRCDNYQFPGNPGCVAPVYTYAPLTGPKPDTNFYAMLFGDVTGNWQPTVALASAKSQSGLEEQKAAAADFELAAKLAQQAPVAIERAPGSPAVLLSIAGSSAPMRAGDRRELTINLKDADGILGLDLALKYDASKIEIVDVKSTGIASGYAVASASANGKTEVSAYGVLPLSGSGQTLTITIQALKSVRGIPVTVSARANEGRIPVQVRGDVSVERTDR